MIRFLFLAQATPADALADPLPIAKLLFAAVMGGDWLAVAAAALVLVVALVRLYGQRLRDALPDHTLGDKALTFLFATKLGGWLLNFFTAVAGAVGTALLAGAPITLVLLKTAAMASLTAAAIWELLKDLLGYFQARKATAAGEAAADTITTPAEAVDSVNRHTGPNP